MEIAEAGENPKALRNIAKALISQAESGDMQAIKEFADRIDGKVSQDIEIDGAVKHSVTVEFITAPARADPTS